MVEANPDAEPHHGLEGPWLLGFGGWGADVYMGVYTERSLRVVRISQGALSPCDGGGVHRRGVG